MKADQPDLIACAAKPRKSWRATIFGNLLHKHATASPAERAIIEPLIFSRLVDYRRDVKRGIAADAATDELLSNYKPTTEHVKRKRKK
jgi:hypothetical protein